MTIWIALLLMVGALLLLLGICTIYLRVERSWPKSDFDERQQIARGKGYRFAFWVGFLYYFGVDIYVIFVDTSSAVSGSLMLAGLMVMVSALEFYCILTHASLSRWQDSKWAGIGFIILGITNIVTSLERILVKSEFYTSLAGSYAKMFTGVCFLTMGLVHLVAFLYRERE